MPRNTSHGDGGMNTGSGVGPPTQPGNGAAVQQAGEAMRAPGVIANNIPSCLSFGRRVLHNIWGCVADHDFGNSGGSSCAILGNSNRFSAIRSSGGSPKLVKFGSSPR